jgi:hypothetical protein
MGAETGGSELNKQYQILVCTSELIFEGTFKCNISQRLIDALNEGVRESPTAKAIDFLPLEDVTIQDAKGTKKKAARIYVAKHNVIFVAQMSTEVKGKQLNAYPYRKKLPVGVTIYAAQMFVAQVYALPYVLKGQLYVETWGQVADTIETHDRFLPLTQVEVQPSPPGEGIQYDFVAINKERIVSICEGAEECF